MACAEEEGGPLGYSRVAFGLLIAFSAYRLWVITYNIYFHPLSKYPGTGLRAASQLPDSISCIKGSQFRALQALHNKHGHVVRIGPNKLSYTDPRAWKDIYALKPDRSEFRKDPAFYGSTQLSIINVAQADHTRLRKAIAPAFNDSSLLSQEYLIRRHFDRLVSSLHNAVDGESKGRVDILGLFNFAAFDIIGDLVLGEPFGALESNEYPQYIHDIFAFVKSLGFVRLATEYRSIGAIFCLLEKLKPSLFAKRDAHLKFTRDKVAKRLATRSERPDLIGHIKHSKANLTDDEIVENCRILLVAGSETTATHLSGAVYLLAKNRAQLHAAQAEVRSLFQSHEQITFQAVGSGEKLPYMNAVIQETFRCYPVVPSILPRVTNASGGIIAGQFVPGNVSVGVHHWSAFYHPDNFHEPSKFAPERWLSAAPIQYQRDRKEILQPFHPGPRGCLGKSLAFVEIRCILAHVLLDFDFRLEAESQTWLEDQNEFSLWDKGPLWVRLERRNV